jgi:hypothetical protein
VGWGVGGIEAEAAMLGQPSSMLIPPVIGCRLTGRLTEGTTAAFTYQPITNSAVDVPSSFGWFSSSFS